MSEDVLAPLTEVLFSGYIGQGSKVDEFERLLSEQLNVPHAITVNSGTSGLHLALRLLQQREGQNIPGRWQPGDEILTTPLTCTATNWAILANHLRLKWVDVDPTTGNVNPADMIDRLSPTTKAIMVVHWGGHSCDLDGLKIVQQTCRERYGFTPAIIEDCAHAWGSTYKGNPIGSHGNLSVFSFQAIKSLTTGDGGLLTTTDPEMDHRARLLRWYGLDRTSTKDFRCAQDIEEWGYKFHMNDINATLGLGNLPHMPGLIATQRENAAFYDRELAGVPGVTLTQQDHSVSESSYWLYTIRVERREDFTQAMNDAGILVSRVHDRNDKHTCVQEFRTASLPGTDIFCSEMICIPCGWWVTPEDRQYIVDKIRAGW
jgi:dTDP-4-amino-4,6-dideoxygalactose transaminase